MNQRPVHTNATVADGQAFLARAFPGMMLRIPIVGQWPAGLRFTLGGDAGWLENDPPRIDRIHERAAAVFEASFGPDDEGFLVAQFEQPTAMMIDEPMSPEDMKVGATISKERTRPIRSPLFADVAALRPYVPDAILATAVMTVGVNLHGTFSEPYGSTEASSDISEVGDDIPYVDVVLSIAPRLLDYRRLLQATANRETPVEPKISCQLFFVNTRTALILNIPDDRGLDIVASSSAVLRPIAASFVAWLVSCYLPPSD
jgi:hypothetical protein